VGELRDEYAAGAGFLMISPSPASLGQARLEMQRQDE
jgi:hypothetical protein